ncbi:MAG: NUDIX domain-containing protein [Candidatus Nanohalobium sp.]
MKDADDFTEIDVAMDVIQHTDSDRYLVLEKGLEYQENRERYNTEKGGVPWEIPGGKIELETEEYTEEEIKAEAWRELDEETSLPIERQEFVEEALTEDSYPGEQETVEITFYPVFYEYVGEPGAVEISPEEHEAYEWITEEEFMERMTENEKEALRRFS